MSRLSVILVLCAVSSATLAFNFIPRTCPPNCLSTYCPFNIGCTSCNPGYCVKRARTGYGVCLPNCGTGSFCNPVGWCNPCGLNCDLCTNRYSCDRCKRGYELDRLGRDCVRSRLG